MLMNSQKSRKNKQKQNYKKEKNNTEIVIS